MNKWFKEFVHNVVIHPLMMLLPVTIANKLHDDNANWAFGNNRYDELLLEGRIMIELTQEEKQLLINAIYSYMSDDYVDWEAECSQELIDRKITNDEWEEEFNICWNNKQQQINTLIEKLK